MEYEIRQSRLPLMCSPTIHALSTDLALISKEVGDCERQLERVSTRHSSCSLRLHCCRRSRMIHLALTDCCCSEAARDDPAACTALRRVLQHERLRQQHPGVRRRRRHYACVNDISLYRTSLCVSLTSVRISSGVDARVAGCS